MLLKSRRRAYHYLLLTFVFLLLVPSTTIARDKIRLATFNCEWLIKDRIHMKYGRNQAFPATSLPYDVRPVMWVLASADK